MKDGLLITGLISNLFYSLAYPVIHTTIMKSLDSRLMSFGSLASCIIVIIVSKIWIKHSEKMYSKFSLMLLLEGILYFILLILTLNKTISMQIYYIIDVILFASITRNIICGGNRLKAIRYKDKSREEFDNKSTVYCNIASILGFGISSIIKFNLHLALIIMFIGVIIDNFIYYKVYKSTNKEYAK